MMSLDYEFKNVLLDHNIFIDDTIHDNEVLGMPFNIDFVLKYK